MPARELRLVFVANLVSMLGSGMNGAAVIWFVLQATHSEQALGWLVILQTLPAMMLLPFSGVLIDREDRRHLVMGLDAVRALVILLVAAFALAGRVQVWHLYAMNILVATAFWIFWPTVSALVQELTPSTSYVSSNTFLLASIQGGWLLAGALVGFVYDHIGLGGILLIDVATYVTSFACYFAVRRGRHTVRQPAQASAASEASGPVAAFFHDLRDARRFLAGAPHVVRLGMTWAIFTSAMVSQGVITASLSDRLLKAGATGYGWLNGGWGIGALTSAFYTPLVIDRFGSSRAASASFALLSIGFFVLPFSPLLAVAVALFISMGSARGVAGVAISGTMMTNVPRHLMGRVQNTFYFVGMAIQIVLAYLVGSLAHRVSLVTAFALIGSVYLAAVLLSAWPARAAGRSGTYR